MEKHTHSPTDGRQTVLIIDDEKDVHYSFRRLLEKEPLAIESAESGDEGIKMARKFMPDLIVMDIRMGQQSGLDTLKELRLINPKQVVIMITAYGTSQTAIEAMKRGAYDYVLKPFDIPHLKQLLAEALAAAKAMKQIVAFPTKLNAEESNQTIVGNSPAMQQVYKLIGQVAPTSTTILITGESGTGKELVARAIFQNSGRADQAVHCHQLRRDSGEPARERALRPREGRVHRRAGAAHRQVRAVRRRHHFPG